MGKRSQIKKSTVCFNVSGEWVTGMAREWLYEEKRPYEKVFDFLLSALSGTDYDNETLTKFAHDILLGKKKMIGNTRDDTYTMVDDDTDVIKEYNSCSFFSNLPPEKPIILPDEDERESNDSVMRNIRAYGKRIREKKLKYKDYGWLSPDGEYFPSEWGTHEAEAYKIIKKYYSKVKPDSIFKIGGDALLEKGWILLHSVSGGSATITSHDFKYLTKKQKEMLWIYLMERDRDDEASRLWQEAA